jgi:hypothetical protein
MTSNSKYIIFTDCEAKNFQYITFVLQPSEDTKCHRLMATEGLSRIGKVEILWQINFMFEFYGYLLPSSYEPGGPLRICDI